MINIEQKPGLLPTVKKRSRFLAHRSSPRQTTDFCTLQGSIHYCQLPHALHAGYTVTKKTGNAVERNRIKRRLRHALAMAVERAGRRQAVRADNDENIFPQHICGELIIIARRRVLTTGHDRLVMELTKGIDRLLTKSKKAS